MDFTFNKYLILISELKSVGYNFFIFRDYLKKGLYDVPRAIILRHDVDKMPENSLKMAKIESEMGINGSYYFRSVDCSFNPEIMKEIENMGHEVGFHYETVNKVEILMRKEGKSVSNTSTANMNKESLIKDKLIEEGYKLFVEELEMFRKIVDVKTICMHGSPRYKYDNRLIWEKYNYKDLGVIGEPYLDIDWKKVAYLTDTGRRWNGNSVNIRDKVNGQMSLDFKNTDNLIKNIDKLPKKLMITIHPQRWTNNPFLWVRELVWQNIKNVVKYIKVKSSK